MDTAEQLTVTLGFFLLSDLYQTNIRKDLTISLVAGTSESGTPFVVLYYYSPCCTCLFPNNSMVTGIYNI